MSRKLDTAPLLAALGGLLLFVSLFLHWYQPALSAWTVFEVWDLVLAVLAVAVVWVAVSDAFLEARAGDRVLAALGAAAFVIVVSQIVNHPPAAQGAKPQIGAWLALFASALMAAAGALRMGGVSLSLTLSGPSREDEREPPAPAAPRGRHRQTPANEAADVEPEVHDELYPHGERRGPIGADDPEPWTAGPDDETLRVETDPDTEEQT
jgi:hypothetical protein